MVRVAGTLAGRYELVEVIGRGGMGVVYRGRDRILDRTVAVKVLPALFAENPTLVERFEREARAAARLSHPNIVSVFDSGQDGTERYIVMEYVPGVSLAGLLQERERLEPSAAVDIAEQIASALAGAHAAEIVHRDVKPANVMVLPSGTAKVLDFGIARAAADAALTRTTMILGSAPYIAPEVALGRPADQRSDIYSLGCVLYEMLAGQPPFEGDLPAVVMNQHTTAEPQPLRELAAGIPVALGALVMQMLAKNPADRPQSAAELASSLKTSLTEPTAPTQVAPAPTPPRAPAAEPPARWSASEPPARSPAVGVPPATAPSGIPPSPRRTGAARRAWLVAAVLILALATGVALALLTSSGSGTSSSSTSHRSSTAPASSSPTGAHTTSTSRTSSGPARSATTTTSAKTSTNSGTSTAKPPSATTPANSGTTTGSAPGP